MMDKELAILIEELTTSTTLTKDTVIKLYEQEYEVCKNAEEAARKVRRRVDFYII